MDFVRNYALPLLLLMALLMAPLAASQASGLYKWTDEEGNVHYTQLPPTERPSQVIIPQPSPSAKSSANDKADDTKLPEGYASTDDAKVKLKQQNCEAARKNLGIYESSEKIRQADGAELILSEEMRAAKIKESQEQIKLYCE